LFVCLQDYFLSLEQILMKFSGGVGHGGDEHCPPRLQGSGFALSECFHLTLSL